MTAKRPPPDDETPILEWVAGAIGLVLFALAIAIMLMNSFKASEPPVITVRPEAAVQIASGFRVEFEVVNSGDETASKVVIEARLRSGNNVVEEHDVMVDFLPPHSTARAGVILKRDPATLVLELDASSYQHP